MLQLQVRHGQSVIKLSNVWLVNDSAFQGIISLFFHNCKLWLVNNSAFYNQLATFFLIS